ncbi:hypothetical protein AURDEDRAFT_170365 [Auricularia subglabra TFB-10046 SS5]|nr:hypothetical protein AURDEDRAFT_170365 [Auricularia subglabra TFB-10046 SS5]
MPTAHYVVRYTLAALGGPSLQNGKDLLFAANRRLLEIEMRLKNEPGMEEVRTRNPRPLVPSDLIPGHKKGMRPPRPGFPDERFFYDLIAFIDHQLIPTVAEIENNFLPIQREPRIMRALNEVRSDINIAAAEIVAAAQPCESEAELRDRINAALEELRKKEEESPKKEKESTKTDPVAERITRAYRRLPLDAIHTVLSFCTSFRDILNVTYTMRWGSRAAATLNRVAFSNPSVHLGLIPRRLSEAWRVYAALPNLQHISIDTPFENSARPRMPAWSRLLSGEVDMSARQAWLPASRFWHTLGALGEHTIREFAVINPTEDAAQYFCWNTGDQAVALAFLRNREEPAPERASPEYDVLIERASGHVRVLRRLEPAFDEHVFDILALRSVAYLAVADDIRDTALRALYGAELKDVAVFEVVLDEKSNEPPQPFQQMPARLLQQPCRSPHPMLRCPAVQVLKISAPRPMKMSNLTVRRFMRMLGSDRTLRVEKDLFYHMDVINGHRGYSAQVCYALLVISLSEVSEPSTTCFPTA